LHTRIPDILSRRALPSGRLAVLGATMDSHHGLLVGSPTSSRIGVQNVTRKESVMATSLADKLAKAVTRAQKTIDQGTG
jgi:hypothetical protein